MDKNSAGFRYGINQDRYKIEHTILNFKKSQYHQDFEDISIPTKVDEDNEILEFNFSLQDNTFHVVVRHQNENSIYFIYEIYVRGYGNKLIERGGYGYYARDVAKLAIEKIRSWRKDKG